ncbi:MAG: hypothetical protein RR361_02855, partial [Anaerovorax sp.]
MKEELLLVLDLGAHNNQQVAKVARLAKVYCEVMPVDLGLSGKGTKEAEKTLNEIVEKANPKGVIFIGEEEAQGRMAANG